jgi:Phage portal protein, SPP1 Gp6-like
VALTPDQAVRVAGEVYDYHTAERGRLDRIRRYWKGRQALPPVVPSDAPREVRIMAQIARVNIIDIVVESLTQSMFVDGFRTSIIDPQTGDGFDEDAPVWQVWQANRMDRGQSKIHRAMFAYGISYAVVTPGDPHPVITPRSPRGLCAMYGEDPDWPEYALERPRSRNGPWRLYDNELVHQLWLDDGRRSGNPRGFVRRPDSTAPHGLQVCPVVQYRDIEDDDLDDEPVPDGSLGYPGAVSDGIVAGQVAPLIPLQDQIDIITFNLLVAQHFAAFKQRYILGWTAENEAERLAVNAARWIALDLDPSEVKIGETTESQLSPYIESRQSSIRHGATLSQTPAHELIGEIVNVSAESLAAIKDGRDRKVDERQTGTGESHEQMLWAVGQMSRPKIVVPDDAQVTWRDTSARSFAATVDGLVKLATIDYPVEMLWERIPGVTQQDIRRAMQIRERGDAMGSLASFLESQAGVPSQNGAQPASNGTGGLILPAGA